MSKPHHTRALGSQGLVTSAIGLGCMGLTVYYGTDTATADADSVIGHAIDRGVTLIDTSDAYGPFVNEEVVGRALKGRREQVILSSKFGLLRKEGNVDGITAGLSGKAEYVKQACEASLRRLQTDYLDLYIQHRLDPDTPIEETVGAMGELVAEGKVRYIGLCEVGPQTIRRGHATFPLSIVHAEYSLWSRDPEDAVLPVVRELGLGFIPYSPLGRGFLTGKIRSIDDLADDDWRRVSPRFQGENFTRNLELVDRVRAIATERGVTSAQLALAWILAQGRFIAPLQGATKMTEIDDNLGAMDLSLNSDDLARIDAAAPRGFATGDAWPEGSVGAMIDRT